MNYKEPTYFKKYSPLSLVFNTKDEIVYRQGNSEIVINKHAIKKFNERLEEKVPQNLKI